MSVKSDINTSVERKRSYRHEQKYLLNYADANVVKSCLRSLLRQDENAGSNGAYKVRSLYFDDYRNSAYEETLMDAAFRSKYRIRMYNDSDADIRLERKQVHYQNITKEYAGLTRVQAERVLRGDYEALLKTGQPLCDEFYFDCVGRVMRPRVIVDYEREPYVFSSGDVRITFDENVRAAVLSSNIFDPDLTSLYLLESHQLLLEVKYAEFLPNLIRKLLPKSGLSKTPFSKYTLACDKTMFFTPNY